MNKTLIIVLLSILATSCINKFQARQNTKTALEYSLQSQQNTLKTLEKVSILSNQALEQNKILSSTNTEVQKFVEHETQEIKKDFEKLNDLKNKIEDDKISKKDSEKLSSQANNLLISTNEKIRLLDRKTMVIVDFLNNESFSKSEMGAIFKPGEYTMNLAQIKQGKILFAPTVQNILSFVDKYKSTFSKFQGEIIITGYSDATPIENGSNLYNNLSNYIKKDDPNAIIDSPALNQKLSELRAISVKNLLQTIISENKTINSNRIKIKLTVLGKGQEIPKGLAEELSDNDFRRRVVTFYWVVLPQL